MEQPLRIIVTGRGGAGSWIVRGEELGLAMGATVKPNATVADLKAHDVAVVVKRVPDALLRALRESGIYWVYDILDAYPQPLCSTWNMGQCLNWLRHHVATLNPPGGVIWPTARMKLDSGLGGPVIYHHHRPNIKRHVVQPNLRCIGYEGSARYIEAWLWPLEKECSRRGVKFLINPEHIGDVDIIVAMRGGDWAGWAQKHWKSNIKLANAHGAGVPFIGANEDGYHETASGGEQWADTPVELGHALDWLDDADTRRAVQAQFLAHAYPVESAARDMLNALLRSD